MFPVAHKQRKLYKIESLENPRIVWELEVDKSRGHVFVDSEAGIVWVSDGAGKLTLLRVEDKGGTFEKKVISGLVSGKLLRPQWVRTDSIGNVYVLDAARASIVKTDPDGKTFREIVKNVGTYNSCGYFCLDREDNLYVTESPSSRNAFRLRKVDSEGRPLKIGGEDFLSFDGDRDWNLGGTFGRVKGVCVDRTGDIYVTGTINSYAPQFRGCRFSPKNVRLTAQDKELHQYNAL